MSTPITADYVFQMAERIEQNGRQFYLLAAEAMPRAGAREMLLQLADMEAQHEKTFAAMRGRLAVEGEPAGPIDPAGETAGYLRALWAGRFFDPQATPADYLKGNESHQEVLLTAIGFEKETIVFYQALKGLLTDGEARETLEGIIREELSHLARLAASLD